MNSEEKKLLKGFVEETLDSMHRTQAEKDLQKDISARVKEETTIGVRVFKRLCKTAFNSNFSEEAAYNDEFEELYEEVMGG